MNKNAILGILVLSLIFLSVSLVSAYTPIVYTPTSYNNYQNAYGEGYSYSSPSYEQVFPSYTYSPTVSNRVLSMNDNSDRYSSTYQGPLIERSYAYDETLKVRSSNKFSRVVSARQSEKFIGEYQTINSLSQNNDRYSSAYDSSSPNPTSYNGGSYWQNSPKYDYNAYGKDSYSNGYYYAPRYDSRAGYYNWRY